MTATTTEPAATAVLRSGYRADLAALRRLRAQHATADPASPTAVCEALTLAHREITLTGGRPDRMLALGTAVDRALDRFPGWADLALLRASLALAVHRPDLARAALAAVPGLDELPPGRVLAADLAQFDGDYEGARTGYLVAEREEPSWEISVRLAALARATGKLEEAEDRYLLAEDDLTVKQLRAFAWVRVQRADLARVLAEYRAAGALLADAERAYAGWWYVAAHRAAVDLAHGRPAAATAGYRRVLDEVDRPEFREALGTALAACGHPDEALGHHRAACAEYRVSADRGEVHYLHHLAAYYADVQPDPVAAVEFARRDVAVRRNGTTLSLLAWCLHRAGHPVEAGEVVQAALALGARDPELIARAWQIEYATGRRSRA